LLQEEYVAYFSHGNVRIYFEDVGYGPPIIANHGLAEDTGYWSESGVTAKLAKNYRVISYDMRGHGRTIVEEQQPGYDADTMEGDIDALADHLGIDRFHLLTHATGGMVGVCYAMHCSERLISLMLTDTGSATFAIWKIPGIEGKEATKQWLKEQAERDAKSQYLTREEKIAQWRAYPGPFSYKMAQRPDYERLYRFLENFGQRRLNNEALAEFRTSFFSDRDPHVEGLRQIKCPTLVLLGEYDIMFIEPSELMAKEIPDVRQVMIKDIGHFTAFEAPERLTQELLDFLRCVEETGRAKRR
jgi:pimeloyl-ACP methyl ester carboxylesterase